MRPPEAFLDTGILTALGNSVQKHSRPAEQLCSSAFVVTSVLNAAELLHGAVSDEEKAAAHEVLARVHVLGFHQRYAAVIAEALNADPPGGLRAAMLAGFCISNRIALVSGDVKQYRGIPHLRVVDINELPSDPDALPQALELRR